MIQANEKTESVVEKVEQELDHRKLSELLEAATRGPWRIDRGVMADSLWITAYEREGLHKAEGDGPICHVSQERMHFSSDKDRHGNVREESKSWKTPIKKARADAELIVAAINALPELLRRLKLDIEEAAWLIEWPADKYGPIRYWAAGEPKPVIDVNHATRFARREDAVAVMGAYAETGAKVHEHLWMVAPKKEAA